MILIKNTINIKNYKIELSLFGILIIALIMLPNILYLFYTPPNDILSGNESNYWLWNILETTGRFGLMIALCFIVNKTAPKKSHFVTIAAACSLLMYYVLWFIYFAGAFNGLSLVGLAFFPSMFFLLMAWRQRNIFAVVFTMLFAIVHIAITSKNFLC